MSKEQEVKVKITNQPKNLTAIFFGVSALVISIFSIALSWYSYNQLLPLQQANIIFSSSDITITPNTSIGGNPPGDMITPLISNIGKSPAENVKFKIYSITATTSIANQFNPLFDDSLVTSLQPGEKVRFGVFVTSYKTSTGMNLAGVTVGIIFHLSYTDGLTKKKKDSIFMYHHLLGKKDPIDSLVSFIQSDYKKIYNVLLENITTTTDAYLYQYLRDNKPE